MIYDATPDVESASTAAFLASKGTYLRYLSHFFSFFESRSESFHSVDAPATYRPRMHDTCKKNGRSAFGGGVYSAIGRRVVSRDKQRRIKGRLCDTRTGIRANNRASHPCASNRKLPGNGDITCDLFALFVLWAFISFFLFLCDLINLVLRLIVWHGDRSSRTWRRKRAPSFPFTINRTDNLNRFLMVIPVSILLAVQLRYTRCSEKRYA